MVGIKIKKSKNMGFGPKSCVPPLGVKEIIPPLW
jgi:hypothetical protein